MLNVILTVHLLACIAMVAVIMLQRSEGGVQGLSGGGTGGIISGRGAASVLVRTTMICAGIFFCTSLVMTRLNADEGAKPNDYEKELQKVNSGANILGTTTPTPGATTSAAPAPAPATPDPFAVLTPAPTGLPTAAPTAAAPAASPSVVAPRPSATATAAAPRPTASAPPATKTPATTPSPATSPQ
jgi:preprotein translocase subunit SecG